MFLFGSLIITLFSSSTIVFITLLMSFICLLLFSSYEISFPSESISLLLFLIKLLLESYSSQTILSSTIFLSILLPSLLILITTGLLLSSISLMIFSLVFIFVIIFFSLPFLSISFVILISSFSSEISFKISFPSLSISLM